MKPGLFRPLLLTAAALGYAAMAMATAIDRETLFDVTAAPGSPPFAAFAEMQRARLAIDAKRADEAMIAAWNGVRAEPIEPAATSLLGSAYLLKREPARAYAAFSVARKLGWRDVQAQAYWLEVGFLRKDLTMSARHLDALMRGAPTLTQTKAVLQQLESEPAGRTALSGRLREGPGWLTDFAAGAADLPPEAFARRELLLRDAALFNQRAPCNAISTPVNRMAYQDGRFAEAFQLWQISCDPQRSDIVGNGSFSQPQPVIATPFAWNLPGASGMSAAIADGVLTARNESFGTGVAASQTLLAPRNLPLRLTWQVTAEHSDPALGRIPALRCPDGTNVLERSAPATRNGDVWQIDLRIPAECQRQVFELRVTRDVGEVKIDRVALEIITLPARRP